MTPWIYTGTLPSIEDPQRRSAPPDVGDGEDEDLCAYDRGYEDRISCHERNPPRYHWDEAKNEWLRGWDAADQFTETVTENTIMKNSTHTTRAGDQFLKTHITAATPWHREAYRPPANPLPCDKTGWPATMLIALAGIIGLLSIVTFLSK